MDIQSPVRFSSCRGVAFEVKPHADPFAISKPDRSSFFPLSNASSRIFSSLITRSISKPSSHFCDLEFEDEDREKNDQNELVLRSLEEEIPVPVTRKQNSRLSVILLDQGLFTVYKRLFLVSLLLNLTSLLLAVTGNFQLGRRRAALFSITNILVLTLCRSEAFLRVIFWSAVKLLGRSWIPVRIKTGVTAFLQSVGGIHSGCGVSSIGWLLYAVLLTIENRADNPTEIVSVAFAILFLLCFSSLAAFPLIRHLHHNLFERIHRFAGWIALLLLWVFILLQVGYNPETKLYENQLCPKLVNELEFYFTAAITLLIILPWLTVRRVPVTVTTSSGHASVIKFSGGVKSGLLARISPSPLSEWHAFGIISDGKTEHMILAGAVGDFTKSLVTNPPTHLWVRQVHFAGLPYLINMYNRVVMVATGSGICVFLSFLLQPCPASVCLVWVAKGIEQNFGMEIKEMVSGHFKDKVIIHDSDVLGRPNVSEMSVDAAKKWGADVVIVTSNPQGSRDVVNACKKAGIPAFGPIWDS